MWTSPIVLCTQIRRGQARYRPERLGHVRSRKTRRPASTRAPVLDGSEVELSIYARMPRRHAAKPPIRPKRDHMAMVEGSETAVD